MVPLFIGLTLVNLAGLATAGALGYAARSGYAVGPWHVLAGALAALTCVAVHCVVFTYFVATAKWVQHAITVKNLDAALAAPTRSFKAQAFPAALLAMASTFAAAVLGAGADNFQGTWPAWHHASAVGAFVVNLLVALVELRAIVRNGRLIDGILARIGAPIS
jgi:integral membrane sensor domain MASE1